jgi:hypothetical protein
MSRWHCLDPCLAGVQNFTVSRFLETLYLRCREQHDSAVRWSAVMVGIVLVLHFHGAHGDGSLETDLAANKRALAQSARAVEASERLAGPLEAFDHSTVGFSSNLLQRFVADLKSTSAGCPRRWTWRCRTRPNPARLFHPKGFPSAVPSRVAVYPSGGGAQRRADAQFTGDFSRGPAVAVERSRPTSIQEARHQPERLRGIVLPIIQQRILEPAFSS